MQIEEWCKLNRVIARQSTAVDRHRHASFLPLEPHHRLFDNISDCCCSSGETSKGKTAVRKPMNWRFGGLHGAVGPQVALRCGQRRMLHAVCSRQRAAALARIAATLRIPYRFLPMQEPEIARGSWHPGGSDSIKAACRTCSGGTTA